MSEIEDGGPAFPVPDQCDGEWNGEPNKGGYFKPYGMSLRDYFAAKAMQAMIATAAAPCMTGLSRSLDMECAKAAYAMADAMLRAREVKA